MTLPKIDVLDHGFVQLVDIMGDDTEVARAARISYGNYDEQRTWAQDAKLIKYLHDNHHTTPFEMIELKFVAKMPIFIARQWIRHRTANINEFSMRYAEPTKLSEQDHIEYYIPDTFPAQNTNNKQGSADPLTTHDQWAARTAYTDACEAATQQYRKLVNLGVSREVARGVLPVSTYTEWVWKNDLYNTLHFLRLRTDEHAQWEMRQYADAMRTLLHEALPRLMPVIDPSYPEPMNRS